MSEIANMPGTGAELRASEVVARNIRALVRWQGWTQAEFGARVGIGRGSISERDRGVKPWTIDEVQRAADVLGVPMSQLFELPTGQGWAPRGSNPQPTDYESGQLATVLDFPAERVA